LGGVESQLNESLLWARKLKAALDNGLRAKISHLQRLRQGIGSLPSFGIPGNLKGSSTEALTAVDDILGRESFYDDAASLGTLSAALDASVSFATEKLCLQQAQIVSDALQSWQHGDDWNELSDEDRIWINAEVDKLLVKSEGTLEGLKQLLGNDYLINHRLRELAGTLESKANESRVAKNKIPSVSEPGGDPITSPAYSVVDAEIIVPKIFKSREQIDLLVGELNKLKNRISSSTQMRITWKEIE